jgi:hypothetical protein
MSRPCPICGAPDGSCGEQQLALPPIAHPAERRNHPVSGDEKVYLPKQKIRRGTAGYKGKNVVVVDEDGKPVKASKN